MVRGREERLEAVGLNSFIKGCSDFDFREVPDLPGPTSPSEDDDQAFTSTEKVKYSELQVRGRSSPGNFQNIETKSEGEKGRNNSLHLAGHK